ncbi:DUF6263 family protein [Terrimonas pollutisoli]|uniref:DUF6263 family protein n=1 Tax=Terrimonas pollutisoli TaxID=3034147 RepID=UPI0023EC55BE|nr:DUF6263 family protein [Terrimonas sp. H1YJ31]
MEKVFLYLFLLVSGTVTYAQSVQGKLQFTEGQKLTIQIDLKTVVTQQAMGKAIDFSSEGSAVHSYKVSAASDNSTTLLHENEKLNFDFEGMGQKHSFNSENPDDTASQFGEYVKNILGKKYELTIDGTGIVLQAKPVKIEVVNPDEKTTMVAGMIKDITAMTYPPRKGDPSFFKVLPAKEISRGESWTDSIKTETGNLKTTYTLSDITDSTIVVTFTSTGSSTSKTMMMGREAVTTMNNNSSGNIVIEGATGILIRKTITTESNGTMEAMGGTMPVTSRSSITIQVKSE